VFDISMMMQFVALQASGKSFIDQTSLRVHAARRNIESRLGEDKGHW